MFITSKGVVLHNGRDGHDDLMEAFFVCCVSDVMSLGFCVPFQ